MGWWLVLTPLPASEGAIPMKALVLSILLQRSLVLAPVRSRRPLAEQGCSPCAFGSCPTGGAVPPGVDEGTGNVLLLLEGAREELQRAVFACGCLSAFAMILFSNGIKLPGRQLLAATQTRSAADPWVGAALFSLPRRSSDPARSAAHPEEHAGSCWQPVRAGVAVPACRQGSTGNVLPFPAFCCLPSQLAESSGTQHFVVAVEAAALVRPG